MVFLSMGNALTIPGVTRLLFTDDRGRIHVALTAFHHADQDLALDPVSINQRFQSDIPVLSTVVVPGATGDSIRVLVPVCTTPPVGNDVRVNLRHVVELRLEQAFDMGHEIPPPDFALALTPDSPEPTLVRQRNAYWEEVNPLMAKCATSTMLNAGSVVRWFA